MLRHPIFRTLSLFLGAYCILSLLGKVAPLDLLLTIVAGFFAVMVWLLRYHRTRLQGIYYKPWATPVINLVCRVAKEQPPVDAASDSSTERDPEEAEAQAVVKLQLQSDGDYRLAASHLKESVRGHDANIDLLVEQIRRNVRLRENSARTTTQGPLGMFLLLGRQGVGKRTLSQYLGQLLYPGGSVVTLDAAGGEGIVAALTLAVRSRPFQVFVIENINLASISVQQQIYAIAGGVPQLDPVSGARVSFRETFLFLLIHREAESVITMRSVANNGTGETLMIESLRDDVGLDKRLAWLLHGIFPFLVPEKIEQAQVVALVMQKECRRYNVELGRIDPQILAREVEAIREGEGFEMVPGRVAKRLNRPILDAIDGGRSRVDLTLAPQSQHVRT